MLEDDLRNANVQPAAWLEFREAGLLYWVNNVLHVFGWSIVLETDMVDGQLVVVSAYPARTNWRGFPPKVTATNHAKLTRHMAQELPRLLRDVEGDPS